MNRSAAAARPCTSVSASSANAFCCESAERSAQPASTPVSPSAVMSERNVSLLRRLPLPSSPSTKSVSAFGVITAYPSRVVTSNSCEPASIQLRSFSAAAASSVTWMAATQAGWSSWPRTPKPARFPSQGLMSVS